MIALDARHLRRIVRSYVAYYNRTRTHLALGKDPPEPRPIQPVAAGEIVALPEVGGLHHRYERRLAAQIARMEFSEGTGELLFQSEQR